MMKEIAATQAKNEGVAQLEIISNSGMKTKNVMKLKEDASTRRCQSQHVSNPNTVPRSDVDDEDMNQSFTYLNSTSERNSNERLNKSTRDDLAILQRKYC